MYTQATHTLNTTVVLRASIIAGLAALIVMVILMIPACLRQRGLGLGPALRDLGVRTRAVPAPRTVREVLAVPELCTLPEARRLTLARHVGRPGARPAELQPGR